MLHSSTRKATPNFFYYLFIVLLLFSSCANKKDKLQLKNRLKIEIDSLNDNSFFYLRKDLNRSFQLAKKADSLARNHQYFSGLARSLRSQAYYFYFSNQSDVSLKYLKESEQIEKRTSKIKGLIATYNAKAFIYKKNKLYREAITNYKKVLRIQESFFVFYKSKITSHNNLANVYAFLTKYDSAVIHYQKALSLAKEQKDTINIAVILTNLGNTQSLLNKYNSAEKNYKQALEFSKYKNNEIQKAKIYNNLGALNFEIYNDSKALFYYKKSLKIKRKLNDSLLLAKSYLNLVELYSQRKNPIIETGFYLNLAEQIFKKLKDRESLTKVYLNKAQKLTKNTQFYQAKKTLEKAALLIEGSQNNVLKSKVYKEQSKVLNKLGQYKKALDKQQVYNSLNDSIFNKDKLWEIAEIEKKNLLKLKQKEIVLLEKDKIISQKNALNEREVNNKLILFLTAVTIISGLLILLILYFYRLKKVANRFTVQQENLFRGEINNLINKQELALVNAALSARKKEKEDIANELHNNIGSLLTSIKFHFNSFDEKFIFSKQPAKKLYIKITNIIDAIIEETRNLSHRFYDDSLPNFSLKNAVLEFSKKIQNKNLDIKTSIHGLENFKNSETSIFIFRVLQELVNNAMKHSKASILILYLTRNLDSINIMVEDNGKGFDTNKVKNGIGLKNLKNQVLILKGQCFVDSKIGYGTTVSITIPIKNNKI